MLYEWFGIFEVPGPKNDFLIFSAVVPVLPEQNH